MLGPEYEVVGGAPPEPGGKGALVMLSSVIGTSNHPRPSGLCWTYESLTRRPTQEPDAKAAVKLTLTALLEHLSSDRNAG